MMSVVGAPSNEDSSHGSGSPWTPKTRSQPPSSRNRALERADNAHSHVMVSDARRDDGPFDALGLGRANVNDRGGDERAGTDDEHRRSAEARHVRPVLAIFW